MENHDPENHSPWQQKCSGVPGVGCPEKHEEHARISSCFRTTPCRASNEAALSHRIHQAEALMVSIPIHQYRLMMTCNFRSHRIHQADALRKVKTNVRHLQPLITMLFHVLRYLRLLRCVVLVRILLLCIMWASLVPVLAPVYTSTNTS